MERLTDQAALQNVQRELQLLSGLSRQLRAPPSSLSPLKSQLRFINGRLWDLEDAIRAKEARKEFDEEFIKMARSVYFTNDERGRIKREINVLLKSGLVEEKQYTRYAPTVDFDITERTQLALDES